MLLVLYGVQQDASSIVFRDLYDAENAYAVLFTP